MAAWWGGGGSQRTKSAAAENGITGDKEEIIPLSTRLKRMFGLGGGGADRRSPPAKASGRKMRRRRKVMLLQPNGRSACVCASLLSGTGAFCFGILPGGHTTTLSAPCVHGSHSHRSPSIEAEPSTGLPQSVSPSVLSFLQHILHYIYM